MLVNRLAFEVGHVGFGVCGQVVEELGFLAVVVAIHVERVVLQFAFHHFVKPAFVLEIAFGAFKILAVKLVVKRYRHFEYQQFTVGDGISVNGAGKFAFHFHLPQGMEKVVANRIVQDQNQQYYGSDSFQGKLHLLKGNGWFQYSKKYMD